MEKGSPSPGIRHREKAKVDSDRAEDDVQAQPIITRVNIYRFGGIVSVSLCHMPI